MSKSHLDPLQMVSLVMFKITAGTSESAAGGSLVIQSGQGTRAGDVLIHADSSESIDGSIGGVIV